MFLQEDNTISEESDNADWKLKDEHEANAQKLASELVKIYITEPY